MRQVGFLLILIVGLVACEQAEVEQVQETSSVEWLEGTSDEKFETITNQFGGFSQAMMEVNYRFAEMYWAGKDENWEYAIYQLDKLESAIENGFERRPGRAESGQRFMNESIPNLMEVFEAGDAAAFENQITLFITACNSCHGKEDVGFMHVEAPQTRFSYIRPPQ